MRGHNRVHIEQRGSSGLRALTDSLKLDLALEDAFLMGFATGGGEVARYVGRHGTRRVAMLD